MKILNSELIEKIKKFVIKRHVILVLIGAPVMGILSFGAMVVYNQSTTFCLKCHYNRGGYFALDLRLEAHKGIGKGGPACLACHPDKAIEKIFIRNLRYDTDHTDPT